ncbi:MAG TPA: hypothetical protein DD387_04725 [Lachnoclostridium sp.]|nr:hypothetical protein [Lachnoclostridium sp.]
MMKKIYKIIFAVTMVICCTGCSGKQTKKIVSPDFSSISSVCQLATLKCYYHNVAKAETEASGFFKWLGVGYKKMWLEYDGTVDLGIDASKVKVGEPDTDGKIRIMIPDAQVMSSDVVIESMGQPLIDTGFMTKVTKEEETEALAKAQSDMVESAKNDEAMLKQAKERAQNLIEGYIKNVGELIGEEYTVIWENEK